MGGWASIWPSAFAGNTTLSFSHARVFPQPRHIMTLDSQPTCLAMGFCHPYILVGTTDGSVWAVNVMRKTYYYRERSSKMRILQHEYRPAERHDGDDSHHDHGMPRGAARILRGFLPEVNEHPKAARIATTKKEKVREEKRKKAKKKQAIDSDDDDDGMYDMMERGDGDFEGTNVIPEPLVIHDPLTRITSVAWNPNAEYSWWAAVAMGSGLIKVLDLGIENERREGKSGDASTENSEVAQEDLEMSSAVDNDDGRSADDSLEG
jgi:transcription factor C subunit 6